MWIKTHNGELVNTDRLVKIGFDNDENGFYVRGYVNEHDIERDDIGGFALGTFEGLYEAEKYLDELTALLTEETDHD